MSTSTDDRRSPARPRRRTGSSGPPVAPVAVPVLDPAQQAVVDHRGGPLLVLAGPGTGKTTTLVEAVVDRVERGGPGGTPLDPSKMLVLTFSREAAIELRTRITARLGRTTTDALAWTFHGFCYALLRRTRRPTGSATRSTCCPAPSSTRSCATCWPARSSSAPRAGPTTCSGLLDRRGFVEEVRRLLARVRQLGLDPVDLAELARVEGRADWAAAAAFCEEYLDVLELRGVLDYGELVRSAAALAGEPAVRAELRSAYDVVLVDEYQDTDPAQEQLLRQLAGDGRELVVVGDPDQSIYAFRGAEVSNILQFPDRFRTAAGAPAGVKVLQTSRRATGELLARSRGIATRIPLPGLPVESVRRHRDLVSVDAAAPVREPGAVARRHDGAAVAPRRPGGRAAAQSRPTSRPCAGPERRPVRCGLRAGVPDRGRGGRGDRRPAAPGAPRGRRRLVVDGGAGAIGHALDPDAAPRARHGRRPGRRRRRRGAARPRAGRPDAPARARRAPSSPVALTAEAVRDLLGSPLVATTPARLRRLGRALRALDRARVTEEGTPPRAVRRAAAGRRARPDGARPDPEDVARPLAAPARAARPRPGDRTRRAARSRTSLWSLWSATPMAAAARAAPRTPAARPVGGPTRTSTPWSRCSTSPPEPRSGSAGSGSPTSSSRCRRSRSRRTRWPSRRSRHDAVRLLTAHRAKGLEWDLVVVAGVQEEVWPDLRRRDSLARRRAGRAARQRGTDGRGPAWARDRRRRGTTALLRRDHPGATPTGRHGGRRRPTTAATGRAGSWPSSACRSRRPATGHDAGSRSPTWSPISARTAIDPTVAPGAARRRHAAPGPPGGGRRRRTGARSCPAPTRPAGGALADETDPGDPMRADDEPIRLSGSALEQLGDLPAAVVPRQGGSRAAPARVERPASARSSTRSPRR